MGIESVYIRKSEYDELVREHLEARAEIVGLEKRWDDAVQAWGKENNEICQLLGKVLGYPWYKDDPKNFPDATEENGVCVGGHVAVTIAAEAASKIKVLQDKLKATEEALVKAKDQETELYTENGQLRFLLQQCQNSLEHTSQCNACQAKTDTLIDDINAQLGKRDARDDAVAHWKKEVAAAREILDSCRENTNYWMEVDTDLRGERNRARYLLKECRPWVERKHSTHHAYCGCELLKQIDEELGEVE